MVAVCLLWPGFNIPTLIPGQSLWSGCGSDIIWCALLSWLTNVTTAPSGTFSTSGVTLLSLMVTVAPAEGLGVAAVAFGAAGALDPPPPQPARSDNPAAHES